MRTINLTIQQQTLTLDSLESLPVQGSDNSVKLAFAFDNSWESYPTRRAYFQYHFSNWKYVELSNDNEVLVPREFLAKPGFKVMIRGYAQSGAIMATNIENVPVEFAPSLADSTAVVPVAIRSGDDAISVEQEGDVVTISLNDEFESNKFVSDYTIRGTASGEIIFLDGVLLGTTEKSFADFKSVYNQIVIPYEFTIGATTYHDTLVATETRYNAQNAYYVADLLPLGQNYTAIVTIYLDGTSVKAVIACLPFTLNNSFDNAPTSGSTKLVNSGAVYSALENVKTLLRAYSDANLATAKSYSDDLLVEGKQYTDTKYNSLVGIITHETEVMEARITSAITQMQNQVNASITGMETTIQGELTALDQRVDEAISTMNTTITTSLTNMETTIQQELANLDTRFSTLQTALEARITTLSNQIDSQFSTLQTQLEGRIDTLEGEVDTKLSEADEAIAILNGYNDRLTKVEGTYVTKIELYEALKRGEISSEVEKVYTSEINYITDNLMPSGKITKILGKTEKSENLHAFSDSIVWTSASQYATKTIGSNISLKAGTYTFSFYVYGGSLPLNKLLGLRSGQSNIELANPYRTYTNGERVVLTFTLQEDTDFISWEVQNYQATTNTITLKYLMLNSGNTALPYSPYYEGLKHTHIVGLKTTKSNLANYNTSSELVNFDVADVKPNTIYTISFSRSTNTGYNLIVKDSDGVILQTVAIGEGGQTITFTTKPFSTDKSPKLHFNGYFSGTSTTNIMLNYGDTALPFVPYEQDTLDISFDGNGVGTAQDEINVEEGKKYQRLGVLDLGTANWNLYTSTGHAQFSTTAIASLIKAPSADNVVANIECARFEASSAQDAWNNPTSSGKIAISHTNAGRIEVQFDSTTLTAEQFKQAMNGVYLVYELATPIVTDISISKDGWIDNLIQGGSITQEIDTTDTTALIAKEVDIAVNVVVDNQ